jgi:hypothetical protein
MFLMFIFLVFFMKCTIFTPLNGHYLDEINTSVDMKRNFVIIVLQLVATTMCKPLTSTISDSSGNTLINVYIYIILITLW